MLVVLILVALLMAMGSNSGDWVAMPALARTALATPQAPAANDVEVGAEDATFSATAFPKEREVVRQLWADEIREVEQRSSSRVPIDVVLVDLNLDGRMDILAVLQHEAFCGMHGCRFVVFIATPDGHWENGGDLIAYASVRVSRHLTRGFRDLIFNTHQGGVAMTAVWEWDGEHYHFAYAY